MLMLDARRSQRLEKKSAVIRRFELASEQKNINTMNQMSKM